MHLSRRLFALSLTLPLVSLPEGPRFAPAEALELTKTYETSFEMTLTDLELSLLINGEEQELGQESELPEVVNTSVQRLVFQDRYERVSDGTVLRLVRTYETLDGESTDTEPDPESGDPQTTESEEESELEGETVVFTRSEDDEEYTASFADEDSELDSDLLEDLAALADFIEFLPGEDVDVDDTWSLEGMAFMDATTFGGDLKLESADDDESDGDFDEQLRENTKGEIECRFVGTEEGEDGELQVIAFAGSLTSEFEAEAEELDEEGVEQTSLISAEFEVEGKLFWNPSTGHARSFEVTIAFEISMDQEVSQSGGRADVKFVTSLTFEGDMKATARFE